LVAAVQVKRLAFAASVVAALALSVGWLPRRNVSLFVGVT